MNQCRRRFLLSTGVLAVAPLLHAQSLPASPWPSRALRLVTGGAGSVTDIRARWLAARMATVLGQPVVVENNPAAGGNVGAELVARSAPDGHTLLFIHQGVAAINPHLYARVGYDALSDFAAVARFGIGMLVLVVPAASPLRTVQDLIHEARRNPKRLNFGTPGNGYPPHLAAVQFNRLAGIESTHIPYKGGGALSAALLSAEVDFAFEGLTAMLPHIQNNRLRPLAVTGTRRLDTLPNVPTLAESGVTGYEYIGWTGVAAPAATPPGIVDRLNREINHIATSEEGRAWFAKIGADAGEQTPAEFAAFMRGEYSKWGRLIREANLKAE